MLVLAVRETSRPPKRKYPERSLIRPSVDVSTLQIDKWKESKALTVSVLERQLTLLSGYNFSFGTASIHYHN